jgi:thermitase
MFWKGYFMKHGYIKVTIIALIFLCVNLLGCSTNNSEKKDPDKMNNYSIAPPNDPFFDTQYYFDTMQVLRAWEFSKGDPNCLVGVLERGVDENHPDLKKNIREVYKLEGMEHPTDYRFNGHGTVVSGIIAAEANNQLGLAGLAPNCNLIVAFVGTHKYKTGTKEEKLKWNKLFSEKTGEGIKYLVDRGCKVINCSLFPYMIPKENFEYAINHDVVVVVASGNNNNELPKILPDGVLVVGGVDKNDKRWKDSFIRTIPYGFHAQGSNYGQVLSVVAPICNLTTCFPADEEALQYLNNHDMNDLKKNKNIQKLLFRKDSGWGTSWAAPMATSLVALIRSSDPELDANAVVEIVKQGADDVGKKGIDKYTGYGRLNFYKSLKLAQTWPRQSN